MRCFFNLVNGQDTILDETGVEASDLEVAKVQALRAIAELRQECGGTLEDWSGWRLDIVCSKGRLLHSLWLNVVMH
jgi:hypothetical protein